MITAYTIFHDLEKKLGLNWLTGQSEEYPIIDINPINSQEQSLIGHVNFIRPNIIQVFGETELTYIQGMHDDARHDAFEKLFSGEAVLILISKSQLPSDELLEQSRKTRIPIFNSSLSSELLIESLHYYLNERLATKTTLHGVFMEVMGIGVFITGESSIGKSELALELLNRGQRLIADDAPLFLRISPDTILGTCPEVLHDFLEVRGLGILNIRAMFGDSAIKKRKYLRLIIQLKDISSWETGEIDRLTGSQQIHNILGVEIPEIVLPVAPGRNLAVLVEAAARNHILRMKGYNSGIAFMEQQQSFIEKNTL